MARALQAIESYVRATTEEFDCVHDSMRLVGEDNLRRYLPVAWLRIRVHHDDSFFEVVARVCAELGIAAESAARSADES